MCVPTLFQLRRAGWRQQVAATTVSPGGSANRTAVVFTQEPPPAFRTAVNLLIIDVQVVAARDKSVPDLTSEQFDVTIAGRKRGVVLAEFVHADEGPINRGAMPAHRDAASLAACVFAFERTEKRATAHYLLGVEPSETDKSGLKQPKVNVNDKALTVRRWAWRSRVRPMVVRPNHIPASSKTPR